MNQLARTGSFGMPRMGSMGSIYTQHVVTPVASDEELIQVRERETKDGDGRGEQLEEKRGESKKEAWRRSR